MLSEWAQKKDKSTPTPASVLVCLFRDNPSDELHILLTRRSSELKHHAGQISFPGGKLEQQDINLRHTAYREANEEVGLNINKLELISQLPKFYTMTGFSITPVISYFTDELKPNELNFDSGEVAEVFSLPLKQIINLQNFKQRVVCINEQSITYYTLKYRNYEIWGATANILYEVGRHAANYKL